MVIGEVQLGSKDLFNKWDMFEIGVQERERELELGKKYKKVR